MSHASAPYARPIHICVKRVQLLLITENVLLRLNDHVEHRRIQSRVDFQIKGLHRITDFHSCGDELMIALGGDN